MDAVEAIMTRRSIRKFGEGPVSEDIIEKILAAAMMAPSACNEQPWHFIVVKDREILKKIPAASPYAMMAKKASFAIVVCVDLKLEKCPGFWVQDCSAAVQNILLACHALGLGAVWTGAYPMQDRVKAIGLLFELPKHVIPLAIIPIGIPAEKPALEKRFKKDRVHKEKW